MKQLVKKDVSKSKPDKEREELKKKIFNYIKMNGDSTLEDIACNSSSDYDYELLKAMTELWEEGELDMGDEGYILCRKEWGKYD